jgi:WD40 repeat protein
MGVLASRRARVGVVLALVGAALAAGWVWLTAPVRSALPLRRVFGSPGGEVWSVGFSPDGAVLAVNSADDDAVVLYDVASGRVRSRLNHAQVFNHAAAFSPDGRRLAVQSERDVKVFDTATGALVTRLPRKGPTSRLSNLQFSPDGTTFTAIDWMEGTNISTPTLRAWETSGWAERPLGPTRYAPRSGQVALAPDGRTLAEDDPGAAAIVLHDLLTGEAKGSLAKPMPVSASVLRLYFSPDGRTLVATIRDGSLAVWDVPTGRLRATPRGHTPGYQPFLWEFGPDTGTLATMGLWLNRPMSLTEHLSLAVSKISFGSGRLWKYQRNVPVEVIVWDVASGRPRLILPGKGNPVISPDGRSLATSEPDGTVKLWDLPGARGSKLAEDRQ